jgi:hypothetical protein
LISDEENMSTAQRRTMVAGIRVVEHVVALVASRRRHA